MNVIFCTVLLGIIGPWQLIFIFLGVLCTILGIVPLIFYLLTLQNTFDEISIENRKMQSGQVWLSLIPLFGLVWQFIIVDKMATSLKAEFAQRNMTIDEAKPEYSIGLTYCILFCCSIIPAIGILTFIGGLVCWIIFWVKINGYKTKLQENRLLSK